MALPQRLLSVALLAMYWGPSTAGAQGEPRCPLPGPGPVLTAGPCGLGCPLASPRKLPDPSAWTSPTSGPLRPSSLPDLPGAPLSSSHTPAYPSLVSGMAYSPSVLPLPTFLVWHSRPLTSRLTAPAFSLPVLLPQTLRSSYSLAQFPTFAPGDSLPGPRNLLLGGPAGVLPGPLRPVKPPP